MERGKQPGVLQQGPVWTVRGSAFSWISYRSKEQYFHRCIFLQTMVKWVSVRKLVLLLLEINSLWRWREDVSFQVWIGFPLWLRTCAREIKQAHLAPAYHSAPNLGNSQHWSTDGIPDLHIVKIRGHNFQWLNYQKNVTSSLIGKEEREKKWSCLASMFLTAWMTCSHASYLTVSLLLGYGRCWLKAWGQIQEHPTNREHRRDRRQTPQPAGTVLLLPDSDRAAAWDVHSAAFMLPRALKFCICSGQFWCATPAPAKSRSRKQLFACMSLPGAHHQTLLNAAQDGLSSQRRGCAWLCIDAWSHHSSPFSLAPFFCKRLSRAQTLLP